MTHPRGSMSARITVWSQSVSGFRHLSSRMFVMNARRAMPHFLYIAAITIQAICYACAPENSPRFILPTDSHAHLLHDSAVEKPRWKKKSSRDSRSSSSRLIESRQGKASPHCEHGAIRRSVQIAASTRASNASPNV
jgi:hypothetical protein